MNKAKKLAGEIADAWYLIDHGDPLEVEVQENGPEWSVYVKFRQDGAAYEVTQGIPYSYDAEGTVRALQFHIENGDAQRAYARVEDGDPRQPKPSAEDIPCGCYDGWDIFDTGGDNYEIERCDSCGVYADDGEAGRVAEPQIRDALSLAKWVKENPRDMAMQIISEQVPWTEMQELAEWMQREAEMVRMSRLHNAYSNVYGVLHDAAQKFDAADAENEILRAFITFAYNRLDAFNRGTAGQNQFEQLERMLRDVERQYLK